MRGEDNRCIEEPRFFKGKIRRILYWMTKRDCLQFNCFHDFPGCKLGACVPACRKKPPGKSRTARKFNGRLPGRTSMRRIGMG